MRRREKPQRHNQRWRPDEDEALGHFAAEYDDRQIGVLLDRTTGAIAARRSEKGIRRMEKQGPTAKVNGNLATKAVERPHECPKDDGWERETFNGCNILQAAVTTNCPRGGDSGHGGSTTLHLINDSGTDWRISAIGGRGEFLEAGGGFAVDQPHQIVIGLGGDSEARTFQQALDFAAGRLARQLSTNERQRLKAAPLRYDPIPGWLYRIQGEVLCRQDNDHREAAAGLIRITKDLLEEYRCHEFWPNPGGPNLNQAIQCLYSALEWLERDRTGR